MKTRGGRLRNTRKKKMAKAEVGTKSGPEAVGHAAEVNTIYMFFWNPGAPIAHTLYAIDIPDPLPDPPVDRLRMPEPQQLSPILEFPRQDYPLSMRCVQFDSKLFFLGGEFTKWNDRFESPYPRDVRIFDPTTIAVGSDQNRPYSLCLLREGPKMNTGKRYPLAFVADRKIYVLSGLAQCETNEKLSRFEVFNPDAGDDGSGGWTELEDPPVRGHFKGHAVVNRKVFILSAENDYGLHSFDLDSYEWCNIATFCPQFRRRAEFVEDTLYCCCYARVVISLGPLPAGSSEDELFNHHMRAILAPDVVKHQLPAMNASSSLVHMGNRLFGHVMTGSPGHPTIPDLEHPEIRYISLTMFQALSETYTAGENTFLKAKFLHSANFVIKNYDDGSYLHDCFTLQS